MLGPDCARSYDVYKDGRAKGSPSPVLLSKSWPLNYWHKLQASLAWTLNHTRRDQIYQNINPFCFTNAALQETFSSFNLSSNTHTKKGFMAITPSLNLWISNHDKKPTKTTGVKDRVISQWTVCYKPQFPPFCPGSELFDTFHKINVSFGRLRSKTAMPFLHCTAPDLFWCCYTIFKNITSN